MIFNIEFVGRFFMNFSLLLFMIEYIRTCYFPHDSKEKVVF